MDFGVYPIALHVPVDVLQLLRQLAMSQMSVPILSCGSMLPLEQQQALEHLHRQRCSVAQRTADKLREIQQQISDVLQPPSCPRHDSRTTQTSTCSPLTADRGCGSDDTAACALRPKGSTSSLRNEATSDMQDVYHASGTAAVESVSDDTSPSPSELAGRGSLAMPSPSVLPSSAAAGHAQLHQPHASPRQGGGTKALSSAAAQRDDRQLPLDNAMAEGCKRSSINPVGPANEEPQSASDTGNPATEPDTLNPHSKITNKPHLKVASTGATSPEWPCLLTCPSPGRAATKTSASEAHVPAPPLAAPAPAGSKAAAAAAAAGSTAVAGTAVAPSPAAAAAGPNLTPDTSLSRSSSYVPSAASTPSHRRASGTPSSSPSASAASSAGLAAAAFASKRVRSSQKPAVQTRTTHTRAQQRSQQQQQQQHQQQQPPGSRTPASVPLWNGSTQVTARALPAVDGDGFVSVSRSRRHTGAQSAAVHSAAASTVAPSSSPTGTQARRGSSSAVSPPPASSATRSRSADKGAPRAAPSPVKGVSAARPTPRCEGPVTPRHSCDNLAANGPRHSTCSSACAELSHGATSTAACEDGFAAPSNDTSAGPPACVPADVAAPREPGGSRESDKHRDRSPGSPSHVSAASPVILRVPSGGGGAAAPAPAAASRQAHGSGATAAKHGAKKAATSNESKGDSLLNSERRLDRDRRKRKEKLERQRRARQEKTAKDAADNALLNEAAEERSAAIAEAVAEQHAKEEALRVKELWQQRDAASSTHSSGSKPARIAAAEPTSDIVYTNPLHSNTSTTSRPAKPHTEVTHVPADQCSDTAVPVSSSETSEHQGKDDRLAEEFKRAPLFRLNGEHRPCGSNAFEFNFSVGS